MSRPHPARGNRAFAHARLGVGREAVGDDVVDRQDDLDATLLRLRQGRGTSLDALLLEERRSDLEALRGQRRCRPFRHRPAAPRTRSIKLSTTPNLSDTLAPSQHGDEGPLGILEHACEGGQLRLEQAPGGGRQMTRRCRRPSSGRGGTGPEGVVHEQIAQELRTHAKDPPFALGLPGVEANVLEHPRSCPPGASSMAAATRSPTLSFKAMTGVPKRPSRCRATPESRRESTTSPLGRPR